MSTRVLELELSEQIRPVWGSIDKHDSLRILVRVRGQPRGWITIEDLSQPSISSEQLLDAMRSEADRICRQRVEPHEVDRVRNKRRTSLAVEAEAPYYRLVQLMDDLEYYGGPRTVEQMLAEVDAITVDTVYEYLEACPINVGGHLTSVGPRHWPEGA